MISDIRTTYRPIEKTKNSEYYWQPFTVQLLWRRFLITYTCTRTYMYTYVIYYYYGLIPFFLLNGRRFIYSLYIPILSFVILIGTAGVTVALLYIYIYMYTYYYMCEGPRGGWTSLRITVAICRRLWWRRAYLWGALAKLNTMENITFRAPAVWFVRIPYIMYMYTIVPVYGIVKETTTEIKQTHTAKGARTYVVECI